ncbi:hypothetical protein BpHYR1_008417 [Brachionus plicatilis]|uniref:Uncharacterized protein n=1 Tax=Brachionus plicatilis TaxID=10195 RepID=A0A3M7SB47_BRAPC|nr:hypothetical protein BpHYR1_008417 [Brachionus plicatilis]
MKIDVVSLKGKIDDENFKYFFNLLSMNNKRDYYQTCAKEKRKMKNFLMQISCKLFKEKLLFNIFDDKSKVLNKLCPNFTPWSLAPYLTSFKFLDKKFDLKFTSILMMVEKHCSLGETGLGHMRDFFNKQD